MTDAKADVPRVDIAVIGSGAAGLLAAIAARGAIDSRGAHLPATPDAPSVILLDSMEKPGKKILISGGGKCNLTNERVTHDDFVPAGARVVRNILRELPPEAMVRFINDAGVPTFAEPAGKIFPRPGYKARDVLDALMQRAATAGATFRFGHQVTRVEPHDRSGSKADGFVIDGMLRARRVIVATGGKSVPQTGSTGFGFDLARSLGHSLTEPQPALVGITCSGDTSAILAGLTIPAILVLRGRDSGKEHARVAGSLLFTHRGVSGPAGLDASLMYTLPANEPVTIEADFWTLADPAGPWAPYIDLPKPPGACLMPPPRATAPAAVESWLLEATKQNPKRTVGRTLATRLPRGLIEALVVDRDTTLAQLSAEARRRAARAVTAFDLAPDGTEGFRKAEVTAGGVPLAELDRRTLGSRITGDVHFCGEVVDVTGRLGGFNFQWAWASGYVAGRGAASGADSARQRE